MRKKCSLTGTDFNVSARELDFLQRIAPSFAGERFEIPPPELSPDERLRARVLHRNEQYLYRSSSAFSNSSLISVYPPELNSPVVSREEWFADSWDALEHGREFSFDEPFFDQFSSLQKEIPRAATVTVGNENSEFTTGTGYCKNCYLINSSEYCEDCYYSKLLQNCTNVVDSAYCYDSELLYECFDVRKCYDCKWTYHSQNCHSCWFCDDIRSCKNCFLCTNLVGQEYHFLNEKLSKEEYLSKVEEVTSDPSQLNEVLDKFANLRAKRWYKYAQIVNCENCTGDFLRNSKNCHESYDVVDSEDCLHVQVGVKSKDLIDCSNMYINPECSYQVLGTIGTNNVHFCLYVFHSSDLWYCEQCFSCNNCFACIGLRNKQYCIFNKQYDKETYEKTVAKIIHHMRNAGEWGVYFPADLSPFSYNKSLADEYFPLTKEQVLARNYRWEDPVPADYAPATTTANQRIEEVDDSIGNETLACERTGKNYRIQTGELAFYRKMKLPIPKFCPDVRYLNRMDLRNSRKLFKRNCEICNVEVLSPFAENNPKRILCEKDYLEKVS